MACHTPITLTEQKRLVPCGQCMDCYIRLYSTWATRIQIEEKYCKNAYFVTLTYDKDNNPGYLDKKGLQNFFKLYRRHYEKKYNKKSEFKYYAVGEYGERFRRPHYHVIAFNIDLELFYETWNKGIVDVGNVNRDSINYVVSYVVQKKNYGKRKKNPPFAIMSKGIGSSYLNDEIKKWHKQLFISQIVFNKQEKYPMPRYLKQKIFGCETAIKLIGERDKHNAMIDQEYDTVIAKRKYQRELLKRSKKLNIQNYG